MSPKYLLITTADFSKAIERYIDESKPDPLVRKQLEDCQFEWKNGEKNESLLQEIDFEPDFIISGILEWANNYIAIHLNTFCAWNGNPKHGNLFFTCQVYARSPSSPAKGVQKRMVQRFKEDDYLQKITTKAESLIEASIKVTKDQLIEKVHCNDTSAHAIQRSVMTSVESTLDVFELACNLPFLPCTALSRILSDTTGLADRAKLRLLEDAMYDACEAEEENDMVQDLRISKKQKK